VATSNGYCNVVDFCGGHPGRGQCEIEAVCGLLLVFVFAIEFVFCLCYGVCVDVIVGGKVGRFLYGSSPPCSLTARRMGRGEVAFTEKD